MAGGTTGTNWAGFCTLALSVAIAAFLWVCASYVYEFSAVGVSSLLGELTGAFLVGAIIAFVVMRGQRIRRWCLPVALALALLSLASVSTKDIIAAMDERAGASILANVKSVEDLNKAISENPHNLLLRLVKAGMPVKQQTVQRVQALMESLDDKELDLDFLQADLPSLQRYLNALRRAENNMSAAEAKLSQIFDEHLSAARSAVGEVPADEKARAAFIKGFAASAGKDADTLKRYLEAQMKVLNALSKEVAFLISVNGRYKWDPQVGKIMFRLNDDLQTYNGYASEVASTNEELQRAEAELNALAQSRPAVFAR